MGLDEGASPFGVDGCDTTLARRAEAFVGLPAPESLRVAIGSVERHGEETVDGVRGGRRLPDLACGAWVGSE